MKDVRAGKYLMRGGKHAELLKQKKTLGGDLFWHGRITSHLGQRSGLQNAWNVDGTDMAGNPEFDLVDLAFIESTLIQ